MFFLFEGLDLSGKSTLCRALAQAAGWPLRHNSLLPAGESPLYEKARAAHHARSGSDEEIGWMFLDALGDEIARYKESETPVIQDSTILLRSIAFHRSLGNHKLAAAFEELLPAHPKPALAFLCRPSIEVRLKRLEGRISRGNDNPEDYLVRDQPHIFSRMEDEIQALTRSAFEIEPLDTSFLEDLDARQALVRDLVSRMSALALVSPLP